jgi:hypothetical protein
MFSDRRGHDTYRACSGDQNVLAKNLERKGRMNRIAKRIKYRGYVEINALVVFPDIRERDRHKLGETTIRVYAVTKRIRTFVTTASETIATTAADQVPFNTDYVTNVEVIDVRTDLDDLAYEFMAQDRRNLYRALSPSVPVPNMYVGTTNTGPFYFDEHIVYANGRFWNVFQPEALFRLALNYRLHLVCPYLRVLLCLF